MFDMIRTLLGAESPSLEPLQSPADAVLGRRLQVPRGRRARTGRPSQVPSSLHRSVVL